MRTIPYKPIFFISLLLFFSMMTCNGWGSIWHVKADGPGNNNGASWDQTFQTIDEALQQASSGDEIWVAGHIITRHPPLLPTAFYENKGYIGSGIYNSGSSPIVANLHPLGRHRRQWTGDWQLQFFTRCFILRC